MNSKIARIATFALFGILTLAALASAADRKPTAVGVTCVCSKYVLNAEHALVLGTEELFTTSQVAKVDGCNAGQSPEIDKRVHFNCRGVAKEDLAQSCPKAGTSINCMPPTTSPFCGKQRGWIQDNCPGVSYLD